MEVDQNLQCDECKSNLSYNAAYMTSNGLMICEKCAAPFLPTLNLVDDKSDKISLPHTVLETLKCSKCENYLSSGPILIDSNGSSRCGRCPTENLTARNTPYESLAEFMLFPCRFKKFGCTEMVPFTNTVTQHEKECKHRKESCPIMGTQCKWMGVQEEMIDHCRTQHKDRVVSNPLSLSYDMKIPSSCTFLLTAHDNVFIFHTKVCLQTNNIYHIVQHLDRLDKTISCRFDYMVNAIRNNKMVRRVGQIVPQSKFDYESKDFVVTNIKHLQKALSGLDGIVVHININKLANPVSKCPKCNKKVEKFLYQEDGWWFCEDCITEKYTNCKNAGCSHTDLEKKCQKHELFFCPYSTWCWICIKDIRKGEFISHNLKHVDNDLKPDEPWKITQTDIYDKIVLLPTKIGNIVAKYRFNLIEFTIQIRTAIVSKDLHGYYCVLKLYMAGDNVTSKTFVLNNLYNEMHDWKLDVKKSDLPSWADTMCVIINIDKGPKPTLEGVNNVVFQETST